MHFGSLDFFINIRYINNIELIVLKALWHGGVDMKKSEFWSLVYASFIIKIMLFLYIILFLSKTFILTASCYLYVLTDINIFIKLIKIPKLNHLNKKIIFYEERTISKSTQIFYILYSFLSCCLIYILAKSNYENIFTFFIVPYLLFNNALSDTYVTNKYVFIKGVVINFKKISDCEIIKNDNDGIYSSYISIKLKSGGKHELRFKDNEKLLQSYDYIKSQTQNKENYNKW